MLFDGDKTLIALTSRCQLTAGGQDVAATRASDKNINAAGFEDFAKGLYPLPWRRLIRQRLGRIVWNKIHLCPQPVPIY